MNRPNSRPLRALALLIAILTLLPAQAQKQKFTIESFMRDPTDLSAANGSPHARLDGNGDLYAIIKVQSNNPDDDLLEYNFNFQSLNHIVDGIHEGELWLYVQKNAKTITITRDGYATIIKHDLGETLLPGKVYQMQLASTARPVFKQIVQFKVQPSDCQATVLVQSVREGAKPKNLGVVANDGELSESLPYGQYTYTVTARDYADVTGVFTLDDKQKVQVETIKLKPQFAMVTLNAPKDAEIYINGENKGRGTWTGKLSFDTYSVEVRQANHRPASQNIKIDNANPQTIQLATPAPIMGSISVMSHPSGAAINIDGKDYGATPRNVDVIIGTHTVTLSKPNHQNATESVEVKEHETATVNLTLSTIGKMTILSSPTGATLFIDGKEMGETPYSADMASGDYKLRLEKRKCETVEKTVHLDLSHPEVKISLPRQYFKRTGAYLQAAIGAGTMMNANVALGAYISKVNIEVGAAYGLCSATVYALDPDGKDPIPGTLRPMALSAKLGYAVTIGNRMRITPQVGVMAVSAKATGVMDISATCATIGARFEYAVAPAVSIFAAPQGRFAVQKGDAFTRATEVVSSIKGWATGADINLGIAINF